MTSIPILNYHSISEGGTARFIKFTLPQETFALHMRLISEQRYTPITIADYARIIRTSAPLPDRPIIITFDDGFADFYSTAFPILQEFRFSASLYVVTRYIGGTSKWLRPEGEHDRMMITWSQLSEIQKAGIECGTHSETHIHLDTANPNDAREEIFRSKDVLEQKLGNPVHSIAYPYGHFTKTVRKYVIDAGYAVACAVRNAMSHSHDDLYGLARITISHDTDTARLMDFLTGKDLPLAASYEYPWVTGWRQVRRVRQMFSHTSQ